ncbi:MAG: hypothetical protein IT379_15220 [Deltaproteobacteria bacterium]|nr:hypothetical protein [Deltaproteobacteria bacterium]
MRRTIHTASLVPTVAAAVLALSSPALVAHADDDAGHGAYGRFDADLVLALDLGGGLRTDGAGVLAGNVRGRYLDSAGLVLGAERDLDEGAIHVVAAIDLRPVFLARFFLDMEIGDSWIDLLLDSVGLELGAVWARAGERDDGAALLVGGGLEIPVYLRRARGVALRLGVRYVAARERWQHGPEGGLTDTSFVAALVVRTAVSSGIATRAR